MIICISEQALYSSSKLTINMLQYIYTVFFLLLEAQVAHLLFLPAFQWKHFLNCPGYKRTLLTVKCIERRLKVQEIQQLLKFSWNQLNRSASFLNTSWFWWEKNPKCKPMSLWYSVKRNLFSYTMSKRCKISIFLSKMRVSWLCYPSYNRSLINSRTWT